MKSVLRILLSLSAWSLSVFVYAQCDVGVDAGEDIFVCEDDNTVRLAGSISGDNVLDFFWSPGGNLSTTTSLIPLVFLDGNPQSFTLTARGYDPADNLIVNGDFESGDSDFTTEYAPASGGAFGPLSGEGEYTIDDNSSDTHTNFGSCTDHTSGSGQMMVVNGSDIAGQEVWCQQVDVTAGTDYIFNAFAMKVVSDNNDAELQFSIDGVLLGSPFPVSGSVCSWLQFNAPYPAATSGPVEICIVNQNTAVGGNDFALDDIFFGEVCELTDEVNINVVTVEAIASGPIEIPCSGEVTIDASASSSGAGIFYNWTTFDGNIISGDGTPIITVNQPGDYTLEVIFDDGVTACADEVTITVTDDSPTAVAVATTPGRIDCNTPQIQLSGIGSSEGPDWMYSWTTPDGNIVSGETTLTPTIDAGGTYEIVVFNPVSGCTDIEVITVEEALNPPFAGIRPSLAIPCGADGISLDGTLSDSGPDFTYEWITDDGIIISGNEGLTPFVGVAGTYQLIVGQGSNGCTDTATVVVGQEPNDLVVAIAEPDTLNCSPTPVLLNGNGSSAGANVIYEWTTTNGNLTTATDGISAMTDQAGTYVLTVRDTDTGCFTRDSVVVTQDTVPPMIALMVTDSITCAQDSVVISTTGDSGLTYSWSTNNGTILGGQTADSLLAGAGGDYFLVVTEPATGCESRDTMVVREQLAPPVADAGEPVSFTCGTDQATLNGGNSSMGANISYQWATPDGNILSGAGTQVPVIDAIGSYFLEVTNTVTGCSARDTVRIESDDTAPPVSISVAGDLDCNNLFRDLDASASASGEGFTFEWSTSDGNFLNGQTTLIPRIDAAGTYTLTVTDTVNQCAGTRSVTVADNNTPPLASTRPDFRLDCNLPTDTLSAAGSDSGGSFTLSWTTVGGSFVGSSSVSNPMVDSAGLYVLTIVNTETGCITVDSVTVTESFAAPTAEAGLGGAIDCETDMVTLGTNPALSGLDYAWTTTNGMINGNASVAQLVVDTSGTYLLQVTDPDNGCTARDSTQVSYDINLPTVDIAEPGEINCDVGTFSLDASGSSQGAPFILEWRTPDGEIASGGSSATPSITSQGSYTLIITNQDNFCVDSAAVTVMGNVEFPVAEAGDTQRVDCRNGEVALTATGSDQGPGFTLMWSTPDGHFVGDPSTSNPTVDSAGVYYLSVRDEENGCVTVDSVIINEDFDRPEANAGPNQTLTCARTTLELGLNNPVASYRYFWSTFSGNVISGEQAAVATVNRPGNYTFRVTNQANGCSNIDNVQVGIDTITPPLDIAPPAELNCMVASVSLTGAGHPGEMYYWNWTTDGGTFGAATDVATTTASGPGNYTLEIIDPDNGCRRTATVTVGQNIASPVFSLAPAAPLNCLETVRVLTAEELGSGFTYAWSTSDGSILTGGDGANPSVDSAGTYVLTVTNTNNFCSTTDSLEVERYAVPPLLDILPPAELTCLVSQSSLVATTDLDTTAEIIWSTPNGTLDGVTDALTATASAPGVYQVEVTNPENGCFSIRSITVAENRLPPTVTLAENIDLGCFVADFTLAAAASGQGDLTYQWSTTDGMLVSGATELEPVINGIGTYSLIVTDGENGCTASAAVFADQSLLETFDFSLRPPSCERLEGTIQFGDVAGGTPPFAFSIDGGTSFRTDPVFQGLEPDNYVLVIRDANGCELEDATSIVPAPEFELEINPNAVIDFGESFQLNAQINFPLSEVDTIIWLPADSSFSCTNCLNPVVTPHETQSYRVRVETVDGCVAEGFSTLIVNEENPVYFPTAFSPNGDGVNDTYLPFGNLNTVSSIVSMSIFDRWGESVFFREDFAPNEVQFGWDGTLNGKPMNPQVFVFSVEVEFVGGERRTFKGDFTLLR